MINTEFMTEFQAFTKSFNDEGPFSPDLTTDEIFDKMKIFHRQFIDFQKRLDSYSENERHKLPEFDNLDRKFQQLNQLYELYNEINDYKSSICSIFWKDICIENIKSNISDFQRKTTQIPTELTHLAAYFDIQKMIDDFLNKIPLFESLSKSSVQDFQWEEITDLTGISFNQYEELLFGQLFDSKIFIYKDEIFEICESADHKKKLFSMLKEIKNDMQKIEFSFSSYKDKENILLKQFMTSEIITKIEDLMICLSTLKLSKYIGNLQKEVEFLMKKLEITNSVISEWLNAQSLWIKIENIIVINNEQMKEEAKILSKITNHLLSLIHI